MVVKVKLLLIIFPTLISPVLSGLCFSQEALKVWMVFSHYITYPLFACSFSAATSVFHETTHTRPLPVIVITVNAFFVLKLLVFYVLMVVGTQTEVRQQAIYLFMTITTCFVFATLTYSHNGSWGWCRKKCTAQNMHLMGKSFHERWV